MSDILALLRVARRRLQTSELLSAAHVVALVIGVLAVLLMAADRATAGFVPWAWVAPSLAGAGLLAVLIIWWMRRPTDMQVALAVDERLDLREKLSTALHLRAADDPFARAAVEDAVQAARDPKMRELAKRRFTIQSPRGWWAGPLVLAVAFLLSLISPQNLFEREVVAAPEIVEAKQQTDQTLENLVEQAAANEELSNELSDVLGELTEDGIDPDAVRTPEEVRRNAVKKVYELNKRLEEILNGEKGRTEEALRQAMKNLQTPPEGPAKDFAEALADGDFKAAQQALEQLLEKAKNGELNDEQMQQLGEQMQNLAEQLEQLAQQQQQLQEALKQAGLDPQLANNPQALQQAIENNPDLNEQQKQQLQQMAKAQQQACQMCKGMAGACGKMAQAIQNGQPGQIGEAGQQMAGQLNDMEALQQMLQQAQAMANQCQGQCQGLGQGLGMQQALQQWRRGGGMGNWGQGAGGKAPSAPTPTGENKVKANVTTTEGEIIYKTLIEGESVRGESNKGVKQVAANILKDVADQAQLEEQLPRRYHEAHKHFFGQLEQQVRELTEAGGGGGGGAAEDAASSGTGAEGQGSTARSNAGE